MLQPTHRSIGRAAGRGAQRKADVAAAFGPARARFEHLFESMSLFGP
jgi:hypothetical protein